MPIYKVKGAVKDGLQKYRVRVNYTDKNGKAHSITRIEYGAAEARTLESKLIEEYTVKGVPLAPAKMTVQELFDEYMNTKQHEVRKSSLTKTEACIRNGILPYLGDIRIDRLGVQQLQDWKNVMSEKGYAHQTLRNYYGELRALLNYAVRMEYLPKNPISLVGNFKQAYFTEPSKDKLHYYTADEFMKFIAEAKKNAQNSCALREWGYYVFFNIAFYTGARKGEINALKWSDIDGDIMHIRRSITQKLKGGDMETPPKNKSSYRDIQMPLPLIEILSEHKQRQQEDRNFSENYRVCGGISILRDSSITNKNVQFAKAAGLPHIRIHDFRHTHATLLINEGINVQEIARRLGHSDVQQTWQTYAHLYPREEERAIQILNKLT
ncbi:MAG: site-specific integrase [Eubacterium sp.]|nr:site-specific integrase [Eubacterium sp.]